MTSISYDYIYIYINQLVYKLFKFLIYFYDDYNLLLDIYLWIVKLNTSHIIITII